MTADAIYAPNDPSGRHYFYSLHFTHKQTEAQRVKLICPGSHSLSVALVGTRTSSPEPPATWPLLGHSCDLASHIPRQRTTVIAPDSSLDSVGSGYGTRGQPISPMLTGLQGTLSGAPSWPGLVKVWAGVGGGCARGFSCPATGPWTNPNHFRPPS